MLAVLAAVRTALGSCADDLIGRWRGKPRPDGLAHLTAFATHPAPS
ncbi:MAG TPA: hypothetical protein VGE11_15950 [Pseudonocardia sp.]